MQESKSRRRLAPVELTLVVAAIAILTVWSPISSSSHLQSSIGGQARGTGATELASQAGVENQSSASSSVGGSVPSASVWGFHTCVIDTAFTTSSKLFWTPIAQLNSP